MDEEYGYDGWIGSTDGEVVGMAREGSGGVWRGVEGQHGRHDVLKVELAVEL